MGKYDDLIGGFKVTIDVEEVLNEEAAKKVDDKIKKQKSELETPVKINIDTSTVEQKLKTLNGALKQINRELNDAITSNKGLKEVNALINKYQALEKDITKATSALSRSNAERKNSNKLLRETEKIIGKITVSESQTGIAPSVKQDVASTLDLQSKLQAKTEDAVQVEKQYADAVTKTNDALSEKNSRIKHLNESIANQKTWLTYLDAVLNKDSFKTSGKQEAFAKLRNLAENKRYNEGNGYSDTSFQYAEEMDTVALVHAFQEAQRQGVAQSRLSKYITDAGYNYEEALKTLQEQRDFRQRLLTDHQKELASLTGQAIESQVKQEEKLKSAVEDTTSALDKQAKSAQKVAESLKQANTESKKIKISAQEIDDLEFKGKMQGLQTELQQNPNFISNIKSQKNTLLEQLQPVKALVSEISSMSSIKNIPYDTLSQAAANTAKQLATMYDDGIRNTKEYVALQYKLANIIDEIGKKYGGVRGSGAKNSTELRQWLFRSIKDETGYNIAQSNAIDALFGQGEFSIYESDSKTRKQREIAGELLNYQGLRFNGGSGVEDDYKTLTRFDSIINQATKDELKLKESVDAANKSLEQQAKVASNTAAANKKITEESSKLYYNIDENAAKRAKNANSFDDYIPGSATQAYRSAIDELKLVVESKKKEFPDKANELDKLLDTYAKRYAEYINKQNSIDASVPSMMIAGPAGIKPSQKEKQNERRDANWKYFEDRVKTVEDKIKNFGNSASTIRGDGENAVSELEAKIDNLKAAHQVMLDANKYFRKHKTLDGFEGLDDQMRKAVEATRRAWNDPNGQPFPQYTLNNSRAEIKRNEARLAELKSLKSSDGLQEKNDIYSLITDNQDMRIRISFEMGKPDQEIIDMLKGKSFKWSPKNNAWQRQLTKNAIYDTKKLQQSLHEYYKLEDTIQSKSDALKLDNKGSEEKAKFTEKEIENNKKLTISYDELVQKIKEYAKVKNEAVALYNEGKDFSDLVPQLRNRESDIAKYFPVYTEEPLKSAGGVTDLLQAFPGSGFSENDLIKTLSGYLNIKIPQTFEQETSKLNAWFKELSSNVRDSSQFIETYKSSLDKVSSGALGAADAIAQLNAYIKENNLLTSQSSAKNTFSNLDQYVSPYNESEMQKLLKGINIDSMIKSFNMSDENRKILYNDLMKLVSLSAETGRGNHTDKIAGLLDEAIAKVGQNILSNGQISQQSNKKLYSDFYDYMQSKLVQYTEADKQEWGDRAKSIIQKFGTGPYKILSKDSGSRIDTFWSELLELFPQLFNKDTINVQDQLLSYLDAVAKARDEKKNFKANTLIPLSDMPDANQMVYGSLAEIVDKASNSASNITKESQKTSDIIRGQAENEQLLVNKTKEQLALEKQAAKEAEKRAAAAAAAAQARQNLLDSGAAAEVSIEELVKRDLNKAIDTLRGAKNNQTQFINLKEVSSGEDLTEQLSSFANKIAKEANLSVKSIEVKDNTAKLKLYNEELKVAVEQTYRLRQASEEAASAMLELVSASYKQDVKALNENTFDVNGIRQRALAKIEKVRSGLHGLEYDLTSLEKIAKNILSQDDFTRFNNLLKAAQDEIQAIKNATISKNSMNPLANMQRDMQNANIEIQTMASRLQRLGDVDGVAEAKKMIEQMTASVKEFNKAQNAQSQQKAYNQYSNFRSSFEAQLKYINETKRLEAQAAKNNQKYSKQEQDNINAAWKNRFQNDYKYTGGKTASDQSTLDSMSAFYKSEEAKAQQFNNNIRGIYDELISKMKQINNLTTKINDLSMKDAGTGNYAKSISSLQTQKSELVADIRSIYSEISSSLNVKPGENGIAKFFDVARQKAALTSQEIQKFDDLLLQADRIGFNFADKLSSKIQPLANQINTLKKMIADGTISQNGDIAKNVLSADNLLQSKYANLKKHQDASSAMDLMQAVDGMSGYINMLDKMAQKEQQYFAGKTKYTKGTNMQSMVEDAKKSANEVNNIQQKLTQAANNFAKESGAGGAIVTNFVQSADGISKLDFSVLDRGTNSLRNFRMEIGSVTSGTFLTETTIDKTVSKFQAAAKQLESIADVIARLKNQGLKEDNSTFSKLSGAQTNLASEVSKGNAADSALLAQYIKEAKIAEAEAEKLLKKHIQLQNALSDGGTSLGKLNLKGDIYGQMTKSVQQFAKTQVNSTLEIGKFNNQTKTLNFTLTDTNGIVKSFKAEMSGLNGEVVAQQTGIRKLQTSWQKLGTDIKTVSKRFLNAFVGYNAFYKVISEFRKGIGYVKEIDLALTELKKVTDETDAAYSRFLNTASGTASKIGSTISDFTNATADFARLGYSMEESASMAESAIIYKNVADGIDNVEESTQSIISTIKAFGIESNDTMGIIDRFNEVGNNFAITSAGIGEALERSASALYEGGNTIDEAIGLITAGNSVIQNPEQVGTALKTLSLRARGAKVELEEAGLETDAMAESTSQLQKKLLALTGGKVDIMLNADEFKSTTQILREMSAVWEDMTDIQQASALELLGGKRQANILASIISNFDVVEDAIETSMNSEGSAIKENEKWLDSIQGKTEQLTNSLQGLWNNALNSGFVKYILDIGISLTNIIDKIGLFKTALAGVVTYLVLVKKNSPVALFNDAASKIKNLQSIITQVSNITSVAGVTKQMSSAAFSAGPAQAYAAAISDLTAKNQAAILSFAGLTEAQQREVLAINGLELSTNKLVASKQATVAITAEEAAEMLANNQLKLGEVAATWLAEEATGELTKAKILDAVASGALKNATHEDIAALLALAGAEGVATVGMKEMTAAMWTMMASNPFGWIMIGIGLLTAALPLLKDAFKSTEDKIKDLQSEWSELENTISTASKGFKDLKSEADEVIPRFVELAEGVDKFGNNVSLPTSEYEEFLSLNNKLAEMFPDINMGMDANGNAMLALSYTSDTLQQSLLDLVEAQRQAANQEIADTMPDVINNIKSTNEQYGKGVKEAEKHKKDLEKAYKLYQNGNYKFRSATGPTNAQIKLFDELGLDYEIKATGGGGSNQVEYEVVFNIDEEAAKRNYENAIAGVDQEIENVNALKSKQWSKLNPVLVAWAETDFTYQGLSEDMQQVAQQMIGNIDFEAQGLETQTEIENYVKNNILNTLNGLTPEVQDKFSKLVNLDATDISFQDYKDKINELAQEIADATDFTLEEVLDSTGYTEVLDDYEKTITKIIDTLGEGFDENSQEFTKLKENVYSLEPNQVTQAFDIIKKYGIKTWDELQSALENKTFEVVVDYDKEQEGIENLTTAIEESVSATGLSSESIEKLKARYQDLENYDPARLFEETANGIHLNTQALQELETAYQKQNQAEIDEQLEGLQEQYDNLTDKINNCTDASERAELYTQRQNIIDKINDTALLAAQYEGLTSAYNQWQQAESAGNERDMYEGILSARGNIEDELSRGWVDQGTREYLELLSGKELSAAPIEEVLAAYKKLNKEIGNSGYNVWDFFTEDEDGNATTEGIFNFLDTVKSKQEELGKEWVKIDKEGNYSFDFGVNGDKAVAEALGVSEEVVQIILRASRDAGFVVNLDGAYTQLANLKDAATAANDELKKLQQNGDKRLKGLDLNFNFSADNVDDLNTELGKATAVLDKFRNEDGTINLSLDGAREALDIASYLTATMDQLSEPVYMQIDTDDVDKNLQEPISKMQQFEDLVKTKHQLTLTGDTKELEEVENKMSEIAQYLDELDGDTKVKLGIDGLDQDEIKKQLETGEIELSSDLKTTVEVEMGEDLEDIRLMMMNQLGLISDDELKLKLNFDLDTTTVDKYTPEQKEAVVKFLENHDDVNKYEPEAKEAAVNFVAEGGDLDGFDDEQRKIAVDFIVENKGLLDDYEIDDKQAVVNYIVNHEEVDDYTPEEKEALIKFVAENSDWLQEYSIEDQTAIVRYFIDDTDVQNYTPEQKKALAKYIADGGNVDSYTPEEKEAFVNYLVDGGDPDKYQPEDKDAVVNYEANTTEPDTYQPKDKEAKVTFWAQIKKKASSLRDKITGGNDVDGTAHVSGTAHISGTARASGTAHAKGSWGAPKTETALVGELGPEMLVRNGRWQTIGEDGAEFTQIKKGDIIFNHKQTEDLLSKGYVTSRGKAYASGTAYSNAKGPSRSTVVSTSLSGSKDKKKSSSKDAKDAKDEFEEVFDWFEVKLEEINEDLDLMAAKLENVVLAKTKNSILDDMIKVNKNELSTLKKGLALYNNYASKLLTKIPKKYRAAAKNGKIAIQTFAGDASEETLNAIKDYREWAQKAADVRKQIEEVRTEVAELAKQKFDNIADKMDRLVTKRENKIESFHDMVDLQEEMGNPVSEKYYKAMIDQINGGTYGKLKQLTKYRQQLQDSLDQSVKNGNIPKYSEQWYDAIEEIYDVDHAIAECNKEIEEYKNAINEIHWNNFDELINRLGYVSDETQNLIDLMGNIEEPVIKPTGKTYENGTVKFWTESDVEWSDEGITQLGLYAQQMELAEYQSKQYAEQIAYLDKEYKAGNYSQTEYYEKLNELKDGQYDAIEAYYDARDAIKDLQEARVDMIKEGIEKEIDAYEELIDKKKEELDAEKDLYDFQKSTKEQQKDIAKIQRKLAALSTDNSMSAIAERKRLEAELAEAKENLDDTYYDRSMDQRQEALDNELDAFQKEKQQEIEKWDEYLENVEKLVTDSLLTVQTNATTIHDTLTAKATEYGLTLSDAVTEPWTKGKDAVASFDEVFGNSTSATLEQLGAIKTEWNNIIAAMNEAAGIEIKNKIAEQQKIESAEKDKKPATSNNTTNKTNTTKKTTTTTTTKAPPKKGATVKVDKTATHFGSKSGGVKMASSVPGGTYTVYQTSGTGKSMQVLIGRKGVYTGWVKLTDLQGYAKGTTGVKKDQLAWIDELGEELQLVPDGNGKLAYLKKGTAVIPSDISENLMKLGQLDPTEVLSRNKPAIELPKEINNTEINLNITYGDMVSIGEFHGDNPDEIAKIVAKQFEKHTRDLNNSLRKYVR